jgi:hypothetical protein
MASKSKRARLTPARNHRNAFLYWSVIIFLVKVLISINIPTTVIDINKNSVLVKGIWLGSDGEGYIRGFYALSQQGIFSTESILNYWPAGYPIIIFLFSIFGSSWVFFTLSFLQSLIFSLATYFFTIQVYKTRLKNYSYLIFILVLLNPTLSLNSLIIGYESLTASGFLLAIGIIIKDLVEQNEKQFFRNLAASSIIFGIMIFMQPRLIIAGVLINLLWIFIRRGVKAKALLVLLSIFLTLIFPSALIYRNNKSLGLNSISTNLGVTMNIGAGDGATGGYMLEGYGVDCETYGTVVQQDSQRVRCVLSWYLDNPTKSLKLFLNKSLFFWSPWINNGFLGEDTIIGTNSRNPWLKVSPFTKMLADPQGEIIVNGSIGKLASWVWLLGGFFLMFYGYFLLWREDFFLRLLGNIALIAIGTNWLISLISIGDHRFRIPIMGLSLFLQAIGLKTLLRGGKPAMVDGPALR